jgi:O-succinylbenzoate synthase
VRACLQIAEEIGMPVVVSSALETSIGIAAGVALAAALPELEYACGLNTVRLLDADVVDVPLVAGHGVIRVRRPEVSQERLDEVRASQDRVDTWRSRITELEGGAEA